MKKFPKGARVCFVGDSITHNGLFIKHILAYYRKYLPESNVEFYNCGIAGGNLGNTIKVFEQDIAIYEPTHIVLMIGINDSRRNRLTESPSKERYDKLFTAFETYGQNMERFYQITREKNIELILCTPMPYAEYQESDIPPLRGGYALMLGYAAYVRKFADMHKLELCDYHKAITMEMQNEILYDPDRVHPNPRGHALMAAVFLASQQSEFIEAPSFSEEIEAWYATSQKLRNIITTEFLTIPEYADMDHSERMLTIKKIHTEMESGNKESDSLLKSLIEEYLVEKPHQADHIAFVKKFMKNQ